jgi:hypothetical protein
MPRCTSKVIQPLIIGPASYIQRIPSAEACHAGVNGAHGAAAAGAIVAARRDGIGSPGGRGGLGTRALATAYEQDQGEGQEQEDTAHRYVPSEGGGRRAASSAPRAILEEVAARHNMPLSLWESLSPTERYTRERQWLAQHGQAHVQKQRPGPVQLSSEQVAALAAMTPAARLSAYRALQQVQQQP